MKLPALHALVAVLWDDAYTVVDAEGADDDTYPVITVGWLVRVTDASLFVANERLPRDHGYRGYTRIPRAIVLSVRAAKGKDL